MQPFSLTRRGRRLQVVSADLEAAQEVFSVRHACVRSLGCWRADTLSFYICLRVEHGSFLTRNRSNMAGSPDEPSSRRRVSICSGAASSQPGCGGASCFFNWWAAADELDGGTGPSEHDGSARHQGPPPGSERQ